MHTHAELVRYPTWEDEKEGQCSQQEQRAHLLPDAAAAAEIGSRDALHREQDEHEQQAEKTYRLQRIAQIQHALALQQPSQIHDGGHNDELRVVSADIDACCGSEDALLTELRQFCVDCAILPVRTFRDVVC
jgi:hypothetical protein